MQIIDRNGFSETISSKERLKALDKIDFKKPQPYEKVMRVYGDGSQTNFSSIITSYHENGEVHEYLEIKDGRARGIFQKRFPNGNLNIEATIIEGMPDITETAMASWVFDGISSIWNEDGALIATIPYNKGFLDKSSLYFHTNGLLAKEIPYEKNLICGEVKLYAKDGTLIELHNYRLGKREGKSYKYALNGELLAEEFYKNDLLLEGTYQNKIAGIIKGEGVRAEFDGDNLTLLIEYKNGLVDGAVKRFNETGVCTGSFTLKNGAKNGEEWEYYNPESGALPEKKLYLYWKADAIQEAKTWYQNGAKQSQITLHGGKKHGLSCAWYIDGSIMFIEEYTSGKLKSGSYYKKNNPIKVSKVENGDGKVTLFDESGHLTEEISYERGEPLPKGY